MNATRKVKVEHLNLNLVCTLCHGYIIDATTIIECLHSFCRSCIVKHLDSSEFCPVCGVQLHSTIPTSSIRSDQMLQEIIYKLVPGLFIREMERRRQFYKSHPESTPTSSADAGQVQNQVYITSDDNINISLELVSRDEEIRESSRRFFYCSAGVSISVLKKLVKMKHDLMEESDIEILYGDRFLPDDFLLMDIAYKYAWTDSMTKPLQLRYRLGGIFHTTEVKVKPARAKRKLRSYTDSAVLKVSNANSSKRQSKTAKTILKERLIGKHKRGSRNSKLSPEEPETKRVRKREEMESLDLSVHVSDTVKTKIVPALPQSPLQEVQLRISESGVMSAIALISGEEKVASNSLTYGVPKVANTAETCVPTFSPQQFLSVLPSTSSVVPTSTEVTTNDLTANSKHEIRPSNKNLKTHKNSINSNSNSKTPTATPTNGKIKKPKKLTSTTSSENSSQSQWLSPDKMGPGIPSAHKQLTMTKDTCFESTKAQVQIAMMELQRKHINSNADGTQVKQNKKTAKKLSLPLVKKSKSHDKVGHKKPNTELNGSSSIPLPFPLHALASSGMTVNLISDIKQQSRLNGDNSNGPSPNKKSKPSTPLTNGNGNGLMFKPATLSLKDIPISPVQITPTTINHSSPHKSPKFFKSKHSSQNREDKNKGKVNGSPKNTCHNNSKTKTPNIASTTDAMAKAMPPLHFHPPVTTDVKLINSTSSNKPITTTTPSRMTLPSTTASPITSSDPLGQLMRLHYWNAMSNVVQNAMPYNRGIGTPFYPPLVTNDYISMPFPNARPANAGMNVTPTYSLVYNSLPLQNYTFTSNNNMNGGLSITPTTSLSMSTTSQTTAATTSPLKTKESHRVKEAKTNGSLDLTKPKNKKSNSLSLTKLNNNNNDPHKKIPNSFGSVSKAILKEKAKGDKEKGLKEGVTLSTTENVTKETLDKTVLNCDKRTEESTNKPESDPVVPESRNALHPEVKVNVTCSIVSGAGLVLDHERFSPEESRDSNGLVINEDEAETTADTDGGSPSGEKTEISGLLSEVNDGNKEEEHGHNTDITSNGSEKDGTDDNNETLDRNHVSTKDTTIADNNNEPEPDPLNVLQMKLQTAVELI